MLGVGATVAGSCASDAARLAVAASLGPPSTAHFHVLTDSASGLQPLGSQNQVAMAAIVPPVSSDAANAKEEAKTDASEADTDSKQTATVKVGFVHLCSATH